MAIVEKGREEIRLASAYLLEHGWTHEDIAALMSSAVEDAPPPTQAAPERPAKKPRPQKPAPGSEGKAEAKVTSSDQISGREPPKAKKPALGSEGKAEAKVTSSNDQVVGQDTDAMAVDGGVAEEEKPEREFTVVNAHGKMKRVNPAAKTRLEAGTLISRSKPAGFACEDYWLGSCARGDGTCEFTHDWVDTLVRSQNFKAASRSGSLPAHALKALRDFDFRKKNAADKAAAPEHNTVLHKLPAKCAEAEKPSGLSASTGAEERQQAEKPVKLPQATGERWSEMASNLGFSEGEEDAIVASPKSTS
ncbi:hypothetical protein BAUCODRAFT_565944 [Baudoinia panamericana UAMH 10762]|uniref:C3H1-type domain-containing protein n=1 Tax=Baudoinia panamericana (strain UAMH 10762) TaxID=717646 RepID=M2ME89_BAUPA|nr:uncharacterized protein BAUCODRAFT_565944 [Baudoinia panamericana UAMH 10762]EMC94896.1 hypothetical protein BAUCODRAFT_565944 [Baudoinia panamericana UAMH 10762]